MNDAVRIAVLSRSSQARDLLRGLLTASGGIVAIEGDPLEVEPDDVSAAAPGVLILSLEPDCDDRVLDRWDEVLRTPGLNVIFDEAQTSGSLAGWDQSRWARHMTSKALGHDTVLPATPGDAALLPEPAEPAEPAEQAELSPALDPPLVHDDIASAGPAADTDTGEAKPAGSDLWLEFALADAASEEASEAAYEVSAELLEATDLTDAIDHDEGLAAMLARFDARHASDSGLIAPDEAGIDDLLRQEPEPSMDEEASALPGPGEDTAGTAVPEDSDLPASGHAQEDDVEADDAPAVRPKFDFSALSLEPVGDESGGAPAAAPAAAPASPGPAHTQPPKVDFDLLAASFGLTPEQPSPPPASVEPTSAKPPPEAPTARRGAVLVMAGLGGPDAIRRFLIALDVTLPVPVLIRQKLEQANHDRLVPQLAKISVAPVRLADAYSDATAGEVCLLPDRIGPRADREIGLSFQLGQDDRSMIGALAELGDSLLIVLLSGSDTHCVKPALACVERGAQLIAQNPEECFDVAAVALAQQNGARTGSPETLAYWVKEHWRS